MKTGNSNMRFYHQCRNLGNYLCNVKLEDLSHDIRNASNVVYKFDCIRNKNCSYIGYTTRKLGICIKEHQRKSSPVGQHLLGCNDCANSHIEDLFKIIFRSNGYNKLRIMEALKIKEFNPALNAQVKNKGASFFINLC